MAVPCASADQRWLKRPPEGEKKRGGRRRERRGESPSLRRSRRGESQRGEQDKIERTGENELGRRRGATGARPVIYPSPFNGQIQRSTRAGEGHQRLARLAGSEAAVPHL